MVLKFYVIPKNKIKKYIFQKICKHNYKLVEDKFNDAGKRMLNHYGYYTKKSECEYCGKEKEHD